MTPTVITRAWGDLLDFVFPLLCASCGNACEESGICERCERKIQRYDKPFCLNCKETIGEGIVCSQCPGGVPLFSLGDYVDPLRGIIIDFKFHGVTSPVARLAHLHSEAFKNLILATGAVNLVPVPLHKDREFERGYNQAAEFAIALGTELGIGVAVCLSRVVKRKEQAKLSFHERGENVRGAFRLLATTEQMKGSKVLLVDDVVTSGHTAMECVRVLKSADLSVVGVLSLAHGV